MNALKTTLFGMSGVALVAFAGLLSAACGGGDDNAAPATTTDAGSDATTTTDAGSDATTDSGDAGTADTGTATAEASAEASTSDAATACQAVFPADAGCTPCGTTDLRNSCSTVSKVQCYPFTLTVPDASF